MDRSALREALGSDGYAVVSGLLTPAQCVRLAGEYSSDALFRSRVVMARHGFGRGEYKYFAYPLPDPVSRLRETLYASVVELANEWQAAMRMESRYPPTHEQFLKRCHEAGQLRPTPLLLRYAAGDYNCLHQDLYGDEVFPLQMAVLLSSPGTDFSGGEFVLTEQRPRMQSRVHVVALEQGDAVVFPVHHRPVQGTRGTYRVNMRHGVSKLHAGSRTTLGIILHDAS